MSEADLLNLQLGLINASWTILIAWIGTTTGMVAAAYFVAHRFSLGLLSGMLGLYLIFTIACITQLARIWQRIAAIGTDLRALFEAGSPLSESALVLLNNIESVVVRSTIVPLILTIFAVSCVYVVICYRAGRKTDN